MLVSISAKKKQTSQQTGSAYREDTKQAVNRYSHSDTAINKCTCSDLTWVPMRRLGQSKSSHTRPVCRWSDKTYRAFQASNIAEAIFHLYRRCLTYGRTRRGLEQRLVASEYRLAFYSIECQKSRGIFKKSHFYFRGTLGHI